MSTRDESVHAARHEALRELVAASDAFDRAVHLSVSSADEDTSDLETTIARYKAAIEKARGLL